MDKFSPTNRVQELAYKIRNIESRYEFEQAISVSPWFVARVTARSWWLNGVTPGMKLENLRTLSSFLKVTIDELAKEDKEKNGKKV
jgi:hypothetical protein